MENTGMTLKDGLKIAYGELAQVNVPAELTFIIGVHVGKALMILKDCLDSMEREEQKPAEEPEDVDLGEIDLGEEKDDA